MEKRTILIIEDDPHIREIYTMMLEMEGYQVLLAENGQVGLDILANCKSQELPHCIILDLTMPVMNGEKFLNHLDINHKDTFGNIPVIVVSAYGTYRRTSQVKDFFEKPVNITSLIQRIEFTTQNLIA